MNDASIIDFKRYYIINDFFHFAFFLYVDMETYSLLYDERFCCDHNHPFLIEGMYLLMEK